MRHSVVRAAAFVARSVLPEQIYVAGKVGLAGWGWKFHGGGPTPGGVKVRWIRRFQRLYKINVLIETGTYRGDMIAATRYNFRTIYSIEMDPRLHQLAAKRFSSFPGVHLLRGSSDQMLADLLPTISERCLFWLDAHFAGEGTAKGDLGCPILGEFAALEQHHIKDHVILIDDADYFKGTHGYPTLLCVEERIKIINSSYRVEVKDNIVMGFIPQ
jgi:hypothetical protein